MLGTQNNPTVSNEPSSTGGIDPNKIRTFLSYSEQTTGGFFQKQRVAQSHEQTGNKEPVIQKNFSADIENNVGNGKPSFVQNSPVDPSPFYTPNEDTPKQKDKTQKNSLAKNDPSLQNILSVSKTNPPIQENPQPKKIDLPKKGSEFSASLQATPEKSDIQNGEQLLVKNYSSSNKEVPLSSNPSSSFFQKKIFTIASIFLLFILGSFGGYSYWKTRTTPVLQEEIPVIIGNSNEPVQNKPANPIPVDKKIAKSLILNASQGKTAITELQKTATEILSYPNNDVFEFFFVNEEKNYEILSEKDLLQQLNITFPENFSTLVKITDEARVYFVKNGQDIRLVLSVPTVSRDTSSSVLLKSEDSLPKLVESLYLSQISIKNNVSGFSNQLYREYAIRYFNLNTEKNYSLDYSFRRDTLYLATSKQSLRDVLNFLDGMDQR